MPYTDTQKAAPFTPFIHGRDKASRRIFSIPSYTSPTASLKPLNEEGEEE
jgi:hypothetical protein